MEVRHAQNIEGMVEMRKLLNKRNAEKHLKRINNILGMITKYAGRNGKPI
jgi:hypothetical protein